jgi:hypothetical protein
VLIDLLIGAISISLGTLPLIVSLFLVIKGRRMVRSFEEQALVQYRAADPEAWANGAPAPPAPKASAARAVWAVGAILLAATVSMYATLLVIAGGLNG